MTVTTGACLCGQVRYRIAAEAGPSRICWCKDCQRIAANGTVNVIFPSAAIETTGTLQRHTREAASGNQVTRSFCPECGTHLFSDSTGRPGFTVVRAGTLDEGSAVKPSANIWTSSAPAWACLDDTLEQFEKGPTAAPAPKA